MVAKHRILVAIAGAAVVTAAAWSFRASSGVSVVTARPAVGSGATLSTSRDALELLAHRMRARVAASPGDGEAAVLLADALVRLARVNGDASLPLEAERAIRATLAHDPGDYTARRMLGVVLLAQHRFAHALDAASAAQRARPDDAWNYAVSGDALLELGQYDKAFAAFDEVNRRRPDAAGYARAAYARELQGNLASAHEYMQMAAEGTGAHDPEAQAWYLSQLGNLLLLEGRFDDAERRFKQAEFTFPGHPYAQAGRARVLIARNQLREAYGLLATAHETPETLAIRGDIAARLGDEGAARRAYAEAERAEREGWQQEEPQPAALARFFADRGLKPAEAIELAEQAAIVRRDIHTMDALAWAYWRGGRVDAAAKAIAVATSTGTRDPRIRCHADAIAASLAGTPPAGEVCQPLDMIIAPSTLGTTAGRP